VPRPRFEVKTISQAGNHPDLHANGDPRSSRFLQFQRPSDCLVRTLRAHASGWSNIPRQLQHLVGQSQRIFRCAAQNPLSARSMVVQRHPPEPEWASCRRGRPLRFVVSSPRDQGWITPTGSAQISLAMTVKRRVARVNDWSDVRWKAQAGSFAAF